MERNYINPTNPSSGFYETTKADVYMDREKSGYDAPRDTRSPRDKWDARNAESKERQRANRERNAKADDNTGNRPIQDNGIDGVPRNPFVSSTSGGTGGGETFTLDVVKDDNTAGTATFNGSGVN